jgi:hypothetical protein
MNPLFLARRGARTDNPDPISSVNMRDNDQSGESRHSERQVSLFVNRMVQVSKGDGQRVTEDRRGFMEGNAAFTRVCAGLLLVLFKYHRVNSRL